MKWFKRKKSKRVSKPKKKDIRSLLKNIEGVHLNQIEIEIWIKHETTLKILRLLKLHRLEFLNSMVRGSMQDDKTLNIMLGRAKGYDDIIELIEQTLANPKDVAEIIETYLSNLKTEI